MTDEQYSRTAVLLGEEKLNKLRRSRVAVFGAGGVGSYAIEALARCGTGSIDIFDGDRIAVSNLNRQLIALKSTVGMYKSDAAAARIADIDGSIKATGHRMFFLPENADEVDFSAFDAVIDAVDTVAAKLEIIVRAQAAGVFVISSMGAGNKLDPSKFTVCDIYETSVCPLARVMRRELRKRGVKSLRTVYSTEEAHPPRIPCEPDERGKLPPGSVSFVPSAAGLLIAAETVKYLTENG
ncbi:MAG: tRNA threonylcarbamoyladenosine dehydratase [Ruminococcus sp.]|nr:tRNA threonylcarbamoyladenosine dehydratase [Ruminococcus sp.]